MGRGGPHGPGHRAVAPVVRGARRGAGYDGATVEVQELPGRTPLLLVDVPPAGGGRADDTVLLYGHLDKQPPFSGWREGLGPWEPVIEGDRLYGRGGADDGYSTFAAVTALEAVQAAGGAHGRCLVLIEASEESGSPDLPAHLDALGDRLGSPVAGRSRSTRGAATGTGCGSRPRCAGLVDMVLEVRVLDEGVHSGSAGGVVPSSFRVLRRLLSRIEDEQHRRAAPPRAARRHPDRAAAPDRCHRPRARRPRPPVPVLGRHPPDASHDRAAADRPDLGAVAGGRRHRRRPRPRPGRQRAAAVDDGEAVGADAPRPPTRRPRPTRWSAASPRTRRSTPPSP